MLSVWAKRCGVYQPYITRIITAIKTFQTTTTTITTDSKYRNVLRRMDLNCLFFHSQRHTQHHWRSNGNVARKYVEKKITTIRITTRSTRNGMARERGEGKGEGEEKLESIQFVIASRINEWTIKRRPDGGWHIRACHPCVSACERSRWQEWKTQLHENGEKNGNATITVC